MNRIENLRDLFIEQGRELYDATRQEQNELPNIRKQVYNQKLQKIIDRQLSTAKTQSNRLEQAFKKLNVSPEGERSECCQAVFKQTQNLINRSRDAEVRDAAIVNSIQRLNHNKITGLGSLTSYAKEIGQGELAKTLHEALNDEKALDHELSELAQKEINRKAAAAPVA